MRLFFALLSVLPLFCQSHPRLIIGSPAVSASPQGFIPSSTPKQRGWEARFAMTADSGGETSRELIRLLVEVVSKGGNLVLTPSAGSTGAIEEIKQWMRINSEAIEDAGPSPFDRMPFFGRATTKGNVLYIHLFAWPADHKLRIPGLSNAIVSAQLLGSTAALKVASTGVVELPAAAPHAAASVIKLVLNGPPKIQPLVVKPDAAGVLTARVESCEFETKPGQVVRKDNVGERVFLSHWTRAIDVPAWKVSVPRDGRYAVEMVYSAGKESAGVVYTVTMKGLTMGMVKGVVESTGSASRKFAASNMELEAGNYMLFVQPENKAGQPAMALEAVLLRRIGD